MEEQNSLGAERDEGKLGTETRQQGLPERVLKMAETPQTHCIVGGLVETAEKDETASWGRCDAGDGGWWGDREGGNATLRGSFDVG